MKKDLYLVTIIGFFFGWLVLLPAKNVGFAITPQFIFASVVGFTVLAPVALSILKLLSRSWGVLYQFGKFAAVGALNSMIDLGVLNFLILLTDIATGIYFTLFKALSFLVAITNSYLWNKFWTFQSKTAVTVKEYVRFAFFTAIGFVINVGIASFVVVVIGPLVGVAPKAWANVAALVAVFISLLWNFFAYRYIVFKPNTDGSNPETGVGVENSFEN